ncbi:extracellular solute-binding protein [Amycolatopsis halotolerans]|uniref:Extracellular solute-binding protein n=1 Tax=Amycolatopsis halotolerans TaxID=330083 RepID=A0ABV7QXI9_9PSEU
MTRLRGLTWDHPRAIDPIVRTSAEYEARTGISVEWTARSLEEFEDVPLDELADEFDLLAIDHPHVGDAARAGALAPLPLEVLENRATAYVGPSLRSYVWENRLMALPVDAACMVSAAKAGTDLPRTWPDVLAQLAALGPARALLAANPTHLWGTLLSMCEAVRPGDLPGWWGDDGLDADTVSEALALLREVLALLPERSFEANPIQVLDELAGAGPALYTPLVFGYCTYARDRRVVFSDAPVAGGRMATGSLTGGVGLAVSARSAQPQEAADFVVFATSPEVQAGVYLAAGGQPAAARAWSDPLAGEFFSGTLSTMQQSFLRPRVPSYPRYQRVAASALHDMIRAGADDARIVVRLNNLWAGAHVG